MTFISKRHAENTAADLRSRAGRNRERAAESTRNGDRLSASIAANNARTLDAEARLADEAARLLGDPDGGSRG